MGQSIKGFKQGLNEEVADDDEQAAKEIASAKGDKPADA
jgi:Sec-independent protein translocase protein TatA